MTKADPIAAAGVSIAVTLLRRHGGGGEPSRRPKGRPDMGSWQKKIGAITLFVEDPDRSKSFYQEVFDLQPMFENETDVGFRLEDTFLFLTKSSRAPELIAPAVVGSPGNGPRHVFAIIVDDVDAVCAELTGKGVALLNGPEDRPWGMRTASFTDPDGYVWEIASEMPKA
jgi:catechol 2,3-dioxygenase-like lactoylglutathione lyase family enzyme